MTTALFILIGILALFAGLQTFVIWRSKRNKGKRVEGLKGELGRAVSSGGRVMAYFYSPNCAACKTQTPIVDRLKKQFLGVFKINVADDIATAQSFGIMATPSTVVVRDGVIQEILIGARTENILRSYLG